MIYKFIKILSGNCNKKCMRYRLRFNNINIVIHINICMKKYKHFCGLSIVPVKYLSIQLTRVL